MDLRTLNNEFISISWQYIQTEDNDLLPKIYVISALLSRILLVFAAREMHVSYNSDETDDSATNVALMYIHKLINRNISNPVVDLTNICNGRLRLSTIRALPDYATRISMLGEFIDDLRPSIDSALCIADTLLNLFARLAKYCSADRLVLNVTYLLINPQAIGSYLNYSSYANKQFVLVLLNEIKRRMRAMDQADGKHGLDSSDTDKILIISELYKKFPELALLLLITKDFKKFVQFVILFSGTTIEMPTVDNIEELINHAKHLGDKMSFARRHDTSLSLRDREQLSIISVMEDDIKDVNENSPVNPIIGEYIKSVFIAMSRSYEKLSDELIRRTNFSDVASIMRSYEVMLTEYSKHVKLFSEISASLSVTEDMRRLASEIGLRHAHRPDKPTRSNASVM